MEKSIFDIGRVRYKINMDAFSNLMEQVSGESSDHKPPTSADAGRDPIDAASANLGDHREIEGLFDDVMQLYREYARTGSMDVLVTLKCLLEEVSLRYRSVALAEEVLNINSCLPYERRVPCNSCGEKLEELRLRH